MKTRRAKIILTSMLVFMMGAVLFVVSQEVQRKQKALYRLERATLQENQSIRVLGAEWAYLNNPTRLEGLVERYLGMGRVAQVRQNMKNVSENLKVNPPIVKPFQNKKYFKKATINGDFNALLREVPKQRR